MPTRECNYEEDFKEYSLAGAAKLSVPGPLETSENNMLSQSVPTVCEALFRSSQELAQFEYRPQVGLNSGLCNPAIEVLY